MIGRRRMCCLYSEGTCELRKKQEKKSSAHEMIWGGKVFCALLK